MGCKQLKKIYIRLKKHSKASLIFTVAKSGKKKDENYDHKLEINVGVKGVAGNFSKGEREDFQKFGEIFGISLLKTLAK